MKRLSIYIMLCLAAMLGSCDIVTSGGGDLDGLWQGLTMEYSDSSRGASVDMRDNEVTWAFQGGLLMMRTNQMEMPVVCRFSHEGNTLTLSDIRFSGRFSDIGDDMPVENPDTLNVLGVFRLDERYQVVELNGGTMRLQSPDVRISFRKY